MLKIYEEKNSYKTSVNQLASTYKKYIREIIDNSIILDYGCGKYTNKIKQFAKDNNIHIDLYDKYNTEYNKIKKTSYNLILCNNVLNVIKSDKEIKILIDDIMQLTNKAIFKIYQGDRTGIERITKINTYQKNKKTIDYTIYFKDYSYKVSGDFIECYK